MCVKDLPYTHKALHLWKETHTNDKMNEEKIFLILGSKTMNHVILILLRREVQND